jgi:hypothetical protein
MRHAGPVQRPPHVNVAEFCRRDAPLARCGGSPIGRPSSGGSQLPGHVIGRGDDPTDPADGGDQLGAGVLGGHRVAEQLGVEGQPAGHLPSDPVPQGPGGIPVREPLQCLEDHDRGHHISRDQRPATMRREQVLEHGYGE